MYNYVVRRSYTNHPGHPENKSLINSPLYKGLWGLFKINNAKFYLLLPEKLLPTAHYPTSLISIKPLGFQFEHMKKLTALLPLTGDFYRNLRNFLKDNAVGHGIEHVDLSKIFITKTQLSLSNQTKGQSPWNIYLHGHGSSAG